MTKRKRNDVNGKQETNNGEKLLNFNPTNSHVSVFFSSEVKKNGTLDDLAEAVVQGEKNEIASQSNSSGIPLNKYLEFTAPKIFKHKTNNSPPYWNEAEKWCLKNHLNWNKLDETTKMSCIKEKAEKIKKEIKEEYQRSVTEYKQQNNST